MSGNSFRGFLEKFSRVASLLPLLWIVGVFALYLRARMHLGFWPMPAFPDPKTLPFEFHHWILMVAVFPMAGTIFILPISWLLRFKQVSQLIRKEVGPYLIGWGLIAAIMISSGKNFIAWFLD